MRHLSKARAPPRSSTKERLKAALAGSLSGAKETPLFNSALRKQPTAYPRRCCASEGDGYVHCSRYLAERASFAAGGAD